jgi:phage tail-like protein
VAYGQQSSYLQYLPAFYSTHPFMGRFLMIFESILGPIEEVLDNISAYMDPGTAPEEFLPWLASWLDLTLDESWPLERRRELVRAAVGLYRWRGTRRGLQEYLRVYTGGHARIEEDFPGIPLAGQARLGWNTVLGQGGGQYTFDVILEVDDPASVDVEKLKAIIDAEKPAHTAYTLQVAARGTAGPGPSAA